MTADFGNAQRIFAEAFGEPGQRTFRVRIEGANGETATLWVEKQQVQALELALRQMLAQLQFQPAEPPDMSGFPQDPEYEFRVGRMSMGYDHSDQRVILQAYELAEDESAEPLMSTKLTSEQCGALRMQLNEIIARGRPMCGLCGAAIDAGGHACIRSNGHMKEPIPDTDADEFDET
jgi:uncharacterized repeat protein (TIGR03847 family)